MANVIYDKGKELFLQGSLLPASKIRFIQDANCVVSETTTVRRTWKERLFTFPWRPLQSIRLEIRTYPDPDVYFIGSNIFIGHPSTIATVVQEIQRNDREL